MPQTDTIQPFDPLNERELEILRLIAAGRTNAEIARTLFLTEGTVKWYNTQIFGKLGVRNRVEAIQAFSAPQPAAVPVPVAPLAAEIQSDIIGRNRELAELTGLLTQPSTRLVTLLGPGGIGKSTLAERVAARLRDVFSDGVFEIPLAAVTQAEQIYPAIADAVGLKPISEKPLPPQLFAHLNGKRLLLVLDNVEQLGEGAEHFKAVLDGAPTVRILTTSRERLNLSDEVVYRLDGLRVPADGHDGNNESVALFLRYALRANPLLTVDDNALATIAEICRFLDGNPLALLLAGSSSDALSLREIADGVAHDPDLLETELRDVPARHRSMRGVLDATWSRLAPAEQRAFAHLSLYCCGFTRAAAQATTGVNVRTLVRLHGKSLVRNIETRYSIHELIRQFGALRLTESGERKEAELEFAEYFLGWLTKWEATLLNLEMSAVDEIDADFENVRLAWSIAVERNRFDLILSCLEGLMQYCRLRGRMADGGTLLSLAMKQAPDERVAARLAEHRSASHEASGQYRRAIEDATRALQRARADGDDRIAIAMLHRQGFSLRKLTKLDEAQIALLEALDLCQRIGDAHAEADTLYQLGKLRFTRGEQLEALDLLKTAMAIVERHEFDDSVAMRVTNGLGDVYSMLGQPAQAKIWHATSLALARRHHNTSYEIQNIEGIGHTNGPYGMGHLAQAIACFEEAITLSGQALTPHEAGFSLAGLALSQHWVGDYASALASAGQATEWAVLLGNGVLQLMSELSLAGLCLDLGLPARALEKYETVLALMRKMNSAYVWNRAVAGGVMCRVRLSDTSHERLRQLERAHADCAREGLDSMTGDVLVAQCEYHITVGNMGDCIGSATRLCDFTRDRQINGQLARALVYLGTALNSSGESSAGIASLREALALAESNRYYRVRIDAHRALQRAYATQADPGNSDLHRRAADGLVAEIAENLKDHPHFLAGLHTL